MDSPERRAPIKPNWGGIMSSPGSAAFMDLCDSLSPIRPVPTFHASTFNELNQMRSPASPNFPTRRLKERRLTNSSASALLLAATTDEAPKTPGLFKREPLRQTFGRNLSRINDASGELSYASEATETRGSKKQVLVVQKGGVVGDLESKANAKDEVAYVTELAGQEELTLRQDSAALKARAEGLVAVQVAVGQEADVHAVSNAAEDEPKAARSKRERDEPQNVAANQPRTVSPSFLRSVKAYAESPSSTVPPSEGKKDGRSGPSPDAEPALPTPPSSNPVLATATPPTQPGASTSQDQTGLAAGLSPPLPAAPIAVSALPQEEQAPKRQKKDEDALPLVLEGAGLQRELSFAVPAVSIERDTKSAAALSCGEGIGVDAVEPLSPTPKGVTSVEGATKREVAQRQTRSRTSEKSASSGRGGVATGALPKGKRSAVHRKKSRFPISGEDSSAAEASSDDTERTVSEGRPSGAANAQALGNSGGAGGEAGNLAGNVSADPVTLKGESGGVANGQLLQHAQDCPEEKPVANVQEPGKAATDSDAESPRRPSPPRDAPAAGGASARHSSPLRATILPQLKGVRSPRKGLRRGQETPTKNPANGTAPCGLPGGQDTVEDLAQLLVDLSEGRTPEKPKRRPSAGEGTPTSNLARPEEVACAASAGREADSAGRSADVGGEDGVKEANQTATGVKVEGAGADDAAQAVSFEQEATPRSAMFVDGKTGVASPGALGGNTGRARRLNFDADAARRQSLTAQDPRLSLEAQGSWPGFSAAPSTHTSPGQSPMYTSPVNGGSTPQTNNGTPQSGPTLQYKPAAPIANVGSVPMANETTPQSGRVPPVPVTVKQEVVERPLQSGQKRTNSEEGGDERGAKRERSSIPDAVYCEVKDGVYGEVKNTSDATAAALSAAMGALSACQTPATCQAAVGGHSQQAAVGRPAHQTLGQVPSQPRQAPQGPASMVRPGALVVRKPVADALARPSGNPTAVSGAAVIRNPQQQKWSAIPNHTNPNHTNPAQAKPSQTAPLQYLSGHQNGLPNPGQQQRFSTPPQQYAQPVQGPARNRNPSPANRQTAPVTSAATSAPAVASSVPAPPVASAPFDPNVAIVPKPPPPPPQPRSAKPLNLARIGAGLSAGTVVRVTPGSAPPPQEPQRYQTGGHSKRASYPPMQRPQMFTTTRFPGYSHYTPSYQKGPPPRQPGPNYQAVSMPFGQPQQPPLGVSPANMQRQKMEAAIDRREAQKDPLSELELDLDLGMELMVVPESPPQPKKAPGGTCKRCHCKKSKCLKLYCECFAANVYCTGCDCIDCQNRPEFEDIVMQKKEEIEKKDPHAFAPKIVEGESPSPTKGETPASAKHKKGCHCKKSMCQKKYCECFQANVACTDACRCENCQNEFGKKGHSHGPHCDPAAWAAAAAAPAPAEAPDTRSPATPGFGRISSFLTSIQRTYPGGGKLVSKKQSLDPYGDEISALDFPHHHPTKEKPLTPPKPEPDTSSLPATSAPPATSAKGRGRKKELKSDLKTVRENQSGATEQTSSGMFPSLSSSPARWSLGAPDFSTPSSYYPTPSSPTNRRGSDTTEFLHLPTSPSPSFGSGPLLRTGAGIGATPPLRAKVRSTALGASIWNPAELTTESPERRNSGHGMHSPGGNGMLKLSNLSGGYYPTEKDMRSAAGDDSLRGGFGMSYANPAGLICDESVDLGEHDNLAESLFREPCGYDGSGDLLSYEQMDFTCSDDMYESPKESAPMSPPPKTLSSAPAFVSLKNLTGGSGRHLNDYPDDPSAALLSPQDGKRRRLSTGRVAEDGTFAIVGGERTPIRMSKAGSPTKIVAPTYAWGESPGRGRTVTPGRKSLNLSNLPSLPPLPGRVSGGEGSGLFTQEAVQQRAP